MSQKTEKQKPAHWPTLNTVIMVEETIKDSNESILSIVKLKRNLPRQVNHNTLITILKYLEESNKIAVTLEGLTWIHNPNPNLKKAISNGIEI